METAENKYITVAYKMYMVEDGEKEFGEEAPVEHPFQFISGLGLTLDAFEKQVKDLAEGDTFDFTIPCADAYGEYDEEHVIELPKSVFLIDGGCDIRPLEKAVAEIIHAPSPVKPDVYPRYYLNFPAGDRSPFLFATARDERKDNQKQGGSYDENFFEQ